MTAAPSPGPGSPAGTTPSSVPTSRPQDPRPRLPVTSVLRTPARHLSRLLGVLSPVGWACLAVLACCLLLGAHPGWQEAWGAAAVLGAVVLSAGLWLLPRGSHSVTHSLLDPYVTVDDYALVRVTVTSTRSRPLLPTRMEMPVGAGRAVFVVPVLPPGGSHDRGFVLPTRRRGVVVVGPVVSVARDPVGLLHLERTRTTAQTVHIHPRTLRLGAVLHGTLRDIEGAVTQDLSSSDVSFHALRDYVAGDDRRHVHWPTTARTGRLMVRQFEETRRSSLLVLLSVRAQDYAGEEDFETAVSVACSLAVDGLRDGRQVRLLTQDTSLPTASPLRLLDASCLLETHEATGTCDDLARHGYATSPEASVVVLVTGQETSRAVLAAARSLVPPSVSMLALRTGQRQLSRLHAGDLPVVDLDRLEQLPTALRKAA
ncbi:DUF58 domain-containing protein [Actinomyces sp. 2119]|uniref:DUF58 domain-containing protein n=1 Tax=Actinomyces sp. 2119 TaxID=2321393 RepID=UPI000E6B7BA4|nr:DUF58 domain-containing protein [Actinomyces sp. 2119]RJF40306.1 DUF58 domain-containing protein [Actinomyces sp. 2119]